MHITDILKAWIFVLFLLARKSDVMKKLDAEYARVKANLTKEIKETEDQLQQLQEVGFMHVERRAMRTVVFNAPCSLQIHEALTAKADSKLAALSEVTHSLCRATSGCPGNSHKFQCVLDLLDGND